MSAPRLHRMLFALAGAACVLSLVCAQASAIVGGKAVRAGTMRYVANLLIYGHEECTGVLVAPRWVLTAGHCTSDSGALSEGLVPSPATFPASGYTVYLGTREASGAGGERHTVSQIIINPKFLVTNGDGNDDALLYLSTPSKQPTMKIAPEEPKLWKAKVMGTIAGFGSTTDSLLARPPTMRYAHVPFVADAYCAEKYPFGPGIVADDGWYDEKTMVCAGYKKGGTDVCEGDSGGPILVHVHGKLELVATTSFGHGCAEPGWPSTYTLAAAGPDRSFLKAHLPSSAFAAAPKPKPKHRKHG